jgi:hypothetical protein
MHGVQGSNLIKHQYPYAWIYVLGLFALAGAVRLYNINSPFMEFNPTRQYHSANIARGYYYGRKDNISVSQKEVAAANLHRSQVIEPRIIEWFSVLGYEVFGGEFYWIPRFFSISFWLAGGAFLYLLARSFLSLSESLCATAIYLLSPYAVLASRSFQPDPLMVMLMVGSVYFFRGYFQKPTFEKCFWSVFFTGAALLVKPQSAFIIFFSVLFMGIGKWGLLKTIFNSRLWLIMIFALIPAGIYYGYNFFAGNSFSSQPSMQIQPGLLLQGKYWLGWLHAIAMTVGIPVFLAAICGLFCTDLRSDRKLISGLWVGYIVYGLIFSFAIHTHDYYQLPLFPIVSLTAGPAIWRLICKAYSMDRMIRWGSTALLFLILALIAGISVSPQGSGLRKLLSPEVRHKIEVVCNYSGMDIQRVKYMLRDFTDRVHLLEEIGNKVGHGKHNLFMAVPYNEALKYHGSVSGIFWPERYVIEEQKSRGKDVPTAQVRLANFMAEEKFEYFIAHSPAKLDLLPDLKELLYERYSVIARTSEYVIFDLKAETK